MENATFYIEGLLRQASARYARQYLGLEDANGVDVGYIIQSTPLWQDVRIPLSGAGPGTAPPTFDIFVGTTRAWRFDNAAPEENLHFELQFPHGFNATYGLRLHLHWTSGLAGGVGNVEWNVEATTANILGVFGATNTYTAAGRPANAFEHTVTPIHIFTGLEESALIVGRLFRTIGDTYAGNDVFALSMDGHYATQQTGSIEEF